MPTGRHGKVQREIRFLRGTIRYEVAFDEIVDGTGPRYHFDGAFTVASCRYHQYRPVKKHGRRHLNKHETSKWKEIYLPKAESDALTSLALFQQKRVVPSGQPSSRLSHEQWRRIHRARPYCLLSPDGVFSTSLPPPTPPSK